MKTRILFIMNGMVCGGVERAFLSSLSLIDPNEYDVTCVLLSRKGSLLGEIPSWVRLVEFPFNAMDRYEFDFGRKPAIVQALRSGRILPAIEMLLFRLKWKILKGDEPFNYCRMRKMVWRTRKNLSTEMLEPYSAILVYGGMAGVAIASSVFTTKKKYVWFHLESQPKYESPAYFKCLYRNFDARFCCSRKLADQLNEYYDPETRSFKSFPYYLNPGLYRDLAVRERGFEDICDGLRILSVGRLDEQKGFDLAIEVCSQLKRKGYKFKWYVIGEGSERPKLEAMIREKNLEENFVLLGLKTNPYPYFMQCDIYVQPSRWEGYCLTVAEARVFCKPIVCTNFAGADEQIKNGHTGLIVGEVSAAVIARGVERVLQDSNLRLSFERALAAESADNELSVRARWMELLASAGRSE